MKSTVYTVLYIIKLFEGKCVLSGWPLSGVVYFNILRIYIITGFVQCKSVGALSRDVLVYIIHNLLYAVFKT